MGRIEYAKLYEFYTGFESNNLKLFTSVVAMNKVLVLLDLDYSVGIVIPLFEDEESILKVKSMSEELTSTEHNKKEFSSFPYYVNLIEEEVLAAVFAVGANNVAREITELVGEVLGKAQQLGGEFLVKDTDVLLSVKLSDSLDSLIIGLDEVLEANAVNEEGKNYISIGGKPLNFDYWKEQQEAGVITERGLELIKEIRDTAQIINTTLLVFRRAGEEFEDEFATKIMDDYVKLLGMSLSHYTTHLVAFDPAINSKAYKKLSDKSLAVLNELMELRKSSGEDYYINPETLSVHLGDELEPVLGKLPLLEEVFSNYSASFSEAMAKLLKGLPKNEAIRTPLVRV